MNVITTVPNVSYNIYDKQGNMTEVHNPGGMPDPTLIDHIEEPFIDATIITTTDYIGPIMTLCLGKRGELVRQNYVSGNRVEIHYKMPLGEIVIDFYDKLKSISKGYASFDYHQSGFRPSKLVKLAWIRFFLMIPLQIMMIGLRWQLIIVVVIVFLLLSIGWQRLNKYDWRQDWKAILFIQ